MLKLNEIKKAIRPYGFKMRNGYDDYVNTGIINGALETKNGHEFTFNLNIERVIKSGEFDYEVNIDGLKFNW